MISDQAMLDKALIAHESRRNEALSFLKIAVYLMTIATCVALIVVYRENTFVLCGSIVMLGIAFMHGVELQHEALHGNLFDNRALNRWVGRLTGLPMLVSYTHYRSYHFHHHKCVGTNRDEELFDYTVRSLTNPVSAFVRVWNLIRVPTFLVTFLGMLQGDFPEKVARSARKTLLLEYIALFAALLFAISSPFFMSDILLFVWIIPWLVVAEPLHFLAEIPEHVGCDRSKRSPLKNTRSYKTNALWAYLINYNNFHIEHHLYPSIPAHRLANIHDRIQQGGGHCSTGYWISLLEVLATVRGSPREY